MGCVTNGSEAQLRRIAARIGAAVAVCACALLPGCSSVSHVLADNWPRAIGGLPEGVPPRSQNPPGYMSINDPAPVRDTKKLTPEERAKAEAEMAASRSQNTSQSEETKSQSSTRITPIQ
jgi:hypothetical protein